MTDMNPLSTPPKLIDRAKNILARPRPEWDVIDTEPGSVGSIFTSYAMILAAIPPLAGLIGGQIFGHGALGITYRPSLTAAIGGAVAHYVLSLVGLFVLAWLINMLAPRFGGQKDSLKAFKVAAYAGTAGWLAGIFMLLPMLGVLGLLGLYSFYLLYLGLPRLMRVPTDRAMPYTIVTIVAAALLFILAGALTAPFARLASPTMADGTMEGEMSIPGVGTVDLGKLEAAGKKMEEATRKMEEATKPGAAAVALAPSALQALLPDRIGRFERIEIESAGMAGGAQASARYRAGEDDMKVEIIDMAAMGAMAGIGAAFNVQSNRETATGYDRTKTIDGRLVSESWDRESRDGKYATSIGNRFMLSASGTVASIDELKAAVDAVGPDKLTAMAQ